MIVTARSYLTAGLAALSVGAMVAVPTVAHPPAPDMLVRSVQLTAAERQTVAGLAPGAGHPAAGNGNAQAPDAGHRSAVGASATARDPRIAALVTIGQAAIRLASIPGFVAFDLGVIAGQVVLDLATNVNDVVPDLVNGLKLTVALNNSVFQSETKVLVDSIHELFMPTREVPEAPDTAAIAAIKTATQGDGSTAHMHVAAGEQTAHNGVHLHAVKGAAAAAAPAIDTNTDTKDDNTSATKSHPATGVASRIRHAIGQATKPGVGEHKATAGGHAHASPAAAKPANKSDKKSGKKSGKHAT